jgi:23S rRNA (uracil1939-C5)-methyltransferase
LSPADAPALHYRIPDFDVELAFGPADFVQVNSAMNARMVARAVELLDLSATERVLDLFCGLGNFTLPLARRAGRVLGIEADDALVAAARANAARNAIANVEFRRADLYAGQGQASWDDFSADKWLLDPPRAGAMEVIKRLTDPLPARIVYVSCYPSTLARDAAYLAHSLGYEFRAAGVMDMFPHTSHVASIALFVRPHDAA